MLDVSSLGSSAAICAHVAVAKALEEDPMVVYAMYPTDLEYAESAVHRVACVMSHALAACRRNHQGARLSICQRMQPLQIES